MARLKNKQKGLTLLELIVSILLVVTVILTASSILGSFKKFYYDFVKRHSEIGEVTLFALEHMMNNFIPANLLESQISITMYTTRPKGRKKGFGSGFARVLYLSSRVDVSDPTKYEDDIYHVYEMSTGGDKKGMLYYYTVINGKSSSKKLIASHIKDLRTRELAPNLYKLLIELELPNGKKEEFETAVLLRGRSAQKL